MTPHQKLITAPVSYEAQQQITLTLNRYCDTIDSADFEGFAEIFEHGRWFMVREPGSEPVRQWLEQHIVLHDGHTYSRHEISNLSVRPGQISEEAQFTCYLTISQDLPGESPRLLAHARFEGTFRCVGDEWRWATHTMTPQYFGDVSAHLRDLEL